MWKRAIEWNVEEVYGNDTEVYAFDPVPGAGRDFGVEPGWEEVFGLRKRGPERPEFRNVRCLCISQFDGGDQDKECYGKREDGVSFCGHFWVIFFT